MNDNDEMKHDVGLSMECSEETDDQHSVHVKREPVESEKEDSSDEVALVDSGCDIKAEPPEDVEDRDFTVMRYQGCVESSIFGEGGTDMTSVLVKTEPCDQTEPSDDHVKFEPTRPSNVATFQFETFSSNSPDQIRANPDSNIPFEVDENGQTELHDLESKQVCIKTERCIEEGTENELNSGRSGSAVFSEGPSNVCVFPQADTTKDSTHLEGEWQGLAGLSDTGDEESVGSSCLHPNYSRPGLLPIHVVDPLHGVGIKMEDEDEPSLSVTGVIPNLHTQHAAIQLGLTSPDAEALDLRQAVGQSTGEPTPTLLGAQSKLHEICAKLGKTESPSSLGNLPVGVPSYEDTHCEKPFQLSPVKFTDSIQDDLYNACLCKQCGKAFSGRSALDIHERFCVDKKSALFRCQLCDKVFERKCNFTRHKCSLVEERPHKCKLCEKTFVRPSHLACHELIHAGKKPFKCKYCEKSFTEKPNLARHELIHTGEKPFECKSCCKVFTQKCHLVRHERIHTMERPFECTHCGKAFVQESHLVRHELIHTGEKRYQCKHCQKRFTQNSSLTRHEQIHFQNAETGSVDVTRQKEVDSKINSD